MNLKKLLFTCVFLLSASHSFAKINFTEHHEPDIEADVLKKGIYHLSLNMLVQDDDVSADSFILPFTFSYTPIDNLEFGTALGIISQGSDTGINDLNIGVKYQFMKEDSDKPSISGECGFILPTADYKKNLGPGSTSIIFNWIIQKKVIDIKGFLNIGYKLNTDNPDSLRLGNEFFWNVGGGYALNKKVTAYGALNGINHAPCALNGHSVAGSSFQELYLAPGIKYASDEQFSFYLSPLIGLTDNSYNLILFIGMDTKL